MTDTLYAIEVQHPGDGAVSLERYAGNVLLIVNVASKCGFTPQYEGLEKLYKTYRDRGFRLLAFPCNDFGGQEPGTIEEIRQFCTLNYGVTFDLFEKVHCIGEERHPLYDWLTTHAPETGDVKWNFEKFLIARDGTCAARFSSKTAPDDETLVAAVERELAR
jgi:glutathione peroxidase